MYRTRDRQRQVNIDARLKVVHWSIWLVWITQIITIVIVVHR
jgi:hypothetical protein